MSRTAVILAISLALFPVTASFTHAKFPVETPVASPTYSISIKRAIQRMKLKRQRAVREPDIRLWIARDFIAAPESGGGTRAEQAAGIKVLRAPAEAAKMPALPDGPPVTDARFDFWLSFKFAF